MLSTIFFLLLGPLLLIIYLIIWNLTHQREIKAALKDKQINTPYGDKLPANYSSPQKRWTLVIVLYMVVILLVALFLVFKGLFNLAAVLLPFAILGWLLLIKIGNRQAK